MVLGHLQLISLRRYIGVKDIYMKAGVKINILHEWMKSRGLKPEEVAYAGDDIPDYEVMRHVGLQCSSRCGSRNKGRLHDTYRHAMADMV